MDIEPIAIKLAFNANPDKPAMAKPPIWQSHPDGYLGFQINFRFSQNKKGRQPELAAC